MKEWRLQGRRARRAAERDAFENTVKTATSRFVEEGGISHKAANPALHSFSQTPLSELDLKQLPSLNTIFNKGNERLGFDDSFGTLCMSRAPLHELERYRGQVWPLEAIAWRIRKMRQLLQTSPMGMYDILIVIDLCTELCLISIFVDEADEATAAHRSAYTALLTLLCSKTGMYTRPMTTVFEAVAMVINYWALG